MCNFIRTLNILTISAILYWLSSCKENNDLLKITTDNNASCHDCILYLVESANVPTISDSIELSRFITVNQMPSAFDSVAFNKTDNQKVLRLERKNYGTILKTANYQTDLLLTINNESNDRDYVFTLHTFDKDRNKIGHLEFASWRENNHWSGKISNDTIVEIKCDETGELKRFQVSITGTFKLLATNK